VRVCRLCVLEVNNPKERNACSGSWLILEAGYRRYDYHRLQQAGDVDDGCIIINS